MVNVIFSLKIIQYSRTFAPQLQTYHGTKPMHPSMLRDLKRHQEHDLKPSQFDGSHNYEAKQTTFLHIDLRFQV
jgi:hypothetical protein